MSIMSSSQSSVSLMNRYESDSDKENQPNEDKSNEVKKRRGKDRGYELAERDISVEEALKIIEEERIWSKSKLSKTKIFFLRNGCYNS